MTWLSFIAEIAKACAWPATALIGLYTLRREIRSLLPLLSRLKYKELELQFGNQIADVKAEAQDRLPTPSETSSGSIAGSSALALAAGSPRAAVLEAWMAVDRAARTAIVRSGFPQPVQPYVSPSRVGQALRAAQILDPDQISIYHQLRELRNEAAHSPEFALSQQSAAEYVSLAERLIDVLDSRRDVP